MSNDFSFSFADTEFREPERPKFIYQQVGHRIVTPDATEIAEYKAKWGKEPGQALVVTIRPVSYSLKDGKETFEKRIPLSHDKSGKLWNYKASWESATKIKAITIEDFDKANGLFFEGQDTVLPSWVKRNTDGDKPTYHKVLRVVPDDEAEQVEAATRARAAGRSEAPVDEEVPGGAADEAETVLALVGDGGTLAEIKDRFKESGSSDTTLFAGLVRGKLLDRLVAEGQLAKEGDRYVKQEASVAV